MTANGQRARGGLRNGGLLLLQCAAAALALGAQTPSSSVPAPAPATAPKQVQPSAEQAGASSQQDSAATAAVERETQDAIPHPGVLLDRVAAVVNGQVVLASDVDEEQRLEAFQPVTDAEQAGTREQLLERLIDRQLLLQQAKLQPQTAITDADIDKQIASLRHDIPTCKQYQCETDAGWNRFLADHQITPTQLQEYWRQRLEALRFIEIRFRAGIHVPDSEIKSYYEKTMLPEYEKRHVAPPKLEAVSDRIQEVLLEQRVSGLLSDWLQSLRAQGTVQIVATGADAS